MKDNAIHNVLYLNPGDYLDDDKRIPIQPPKNQEEIEIYKKNTTNNWQELDLNFNRDLLEKVISDRLNKISDINIIQTPILIFNL